MIGCVARAQSYEVLLNTSEMEDVQWYDREELAAAVKAYDAQLPLQEIQRLSWARFGFFVPPPFAIAHHIMRAWALQSGPWFSTDTSGGEGGLGGGHGDAAVGAVDGADGAGADGALD